MAEEEIKTEETELEKMAKENEVLEKNIALKKEQKALEDVGGKADAGEQPEAPKEETGEEYARRIEAGKI